MKLWLDDVRTPPDDWPEGSFVWAVTASQAIGALETNHITEVSLDHDLGDEPWAGEGYDVLLWIEEQVHLHGWKPPKMAIHSANPVAQERMRAAIKSIEGAAV